MLLAGCKFQSSHCCSSGAGLGWTEGRGREGRKAGAGAPRLSSSRILSPRRRATCPRDSRAGRANSRGRVLTNLHEAPGMRASQKAGEPAAGEEKTQRPGGCAPRTCASRRCPGAARGRPGRERARAWTRPRTGAAPAERARGRLRAEGAAQPRRGPRPPTHPPPAPGPRGRLPFSSLHTFFFLLLGYMLPWGWLALSCKFPRLTGRQGVWSVWGGGKWRGHSGGKSAKALRPAPLAARPSPPSSPQPARSAPRPPPQQHLRACQLGHASR